MNQGRQLINGWDLSCYPQLAQCCLWLRPEALPYTNPGQSVPLWPDSSYRRDNFANTNLTTQPALVGPDANGLFYLSFVGVHFLSGAVSLILNGQLSAFVVAEFVGGGINLSSLVLGNQVGVPSYAPAVQTDSMGYRDSSQSSVGPVADVRDSLAIYSVIRWADGLELKQDGAVVSSSANNPAGAVNFAELGNYPASSPELYAVQVAEVLVFPYALSQQDEAYVMSYLSEKYGITLL